ncbi:MAG: alpha/beta fold hydrolase [Acidobacteriota bacterium]|nr:alpha/beta fold hydrolase [Acidobacteriota bacterium]
MRNFAPMLASLLILFALVPQRLETKLTGKVTLEYLLYVPKKQTAEKLPLIVYLHGGSARGDMQKLRGMGLPARVEQDSTFPFIVVAPLLPKGEIWTNDGALMALIDNVSAKQRVDRNRVYLMGHSMGGRGALYVAYKHPERFAAVVAMSAVSPIPFWSTRLREVPIWYFHGAKDVQAPVADAEELIQAIQKSGGDVTYTRMDDRDHFILDTFDRDDVYEWLLQHRRSGR